jgi:hypothetical protein
MKSPKTSFGCLGRLRLFLLQDMACVDCVFDHHGVRLGVPRHIDSAVGNAFDGRCFNTLELTASLQTRDKSKTWIGRKDLWTTRWPLDFSHIAYSGVSYVWCVQRSKGGRCETWLIEVEGAHPRFMLQYGVRRLKWEIRPRNKRRGRGFYVAVVVL